jgi:Ca2+-binding EF-hand superfamily protein
MADKNLRRPLGKRHGWTYIVSKETTIVKTSKTTLTMALWGVAMTALCGFAAPAHAHGGVDEEFKKMDANGDGKISADEHAAGAKMMFEKMDADHDGKVTVAEMDAAHARGDASHEKAEARGPERLSSAEKIKMMDTNGDGVLSADEHALGAKSMFDKMDTDHDGFLTKVELKAGHEKLMSKAHGA